MDVLDISLAAFANYKQFILLKDKLPVTVGGNLFNAHDTTHHLFCKDAVRLAKLLELDVGFVFTKEDPFWFLDIDKCLGKKKKPSELALELLELFRGAAVETSQSKEGLHIFGRGIVPEHLCKNTKLHIEFYTNRRYVSLTGLNAYGNADIDFTPQLELLVDKYFKKKILA